MNSRRPFFLLPLILFLVMPGIGNAQMLKVIDETSKAKGNKIVQKVYREKRNGHAVLCFESSLTNMRIISNANDSIWTEESEGGKRYYLDIDLNEHKSEVSGVTFITSAPRHRELILRVPDAEDYILTTGELVPAVYFYKVILPDNFPVNISAEYVFCLHDSYKSNGVGFVYGWSVMSVIHGVRLAYGGRYGVYCGFRWGGYRPSGQNIDNITIDCDVSSAKFLGLIRRSYVIGTRIGVWNNYFAPFYIYLGGGYGEYGRQWENPFLVLDNKYFHSDYIHGFNGEIGVTALLFGALPVSFGADMVVGNGKMSVDYHIGVGWSLQRALFTRKKTK